MGNQENDPLLQATWSDLEESFGAKTLNRGKGYQSSDRVNEVVRVEPGCILGRVVGSRTYAVRVALDRSENGRIPVTDCTCPVGVSCKHAVALILEYIARMRDGIPIRELTEEQGYEEYRDLFDKAFPDSGPAAPSSGATAQDEVQLRSYLEGKDTPWLVDLVVQLCGRFPDVSSAVRDKMDMETRSGDRLLKELRNEVAHLGSELEDFDPQMELNPGFDLSRLEEVMESLLELGYADELLAAGRKLHRKGLDLIEHFDEDGSLTMELQPCLDMVFKALPHSSLSRSEQILWAIDMDLRDWFDLCEGIHNFLDLSLPKEAWSQAADALLKRLSKQKETSRSQSVFSKTDRERLVDWITLALEKADRLDEITSLLEGEAKKTGRTTPLVNHLIRLGRQEEAKGWIARERQAARKQGSGLSSLDSELIQRFLEIMELEGNWAGIQTLKAETFFDRPTLEAYTELLASADRTDCRAEARQAALAFLESGVLPRERPNWLAVSRQEYADLKQGIQNRKGDRFPKAGLLAAIALQEKDPEQALRWYRSPIGASWSQGPSANQLAKGLGKAYPDEAVAIWKDQTEREIAKVKPAAYQRAGGSLRQVKKTLQKAGRDREWQGYLAELRERHGRKTRLMEVLDSLEDATIYDSGKSRSGKKKG